MISNVYSRRNCRFIFIPSESKFNKLDDSLMSLTLYLTNAFDMITTYNNDYNLAIYIFSNASGIIKDIGKVYYML